jgi:hypothetical protein
MSSAVRVKLTAVHYFEKASEDELLDMMKGDDDHAFELDYDGNTALDWALNVGISLVLRVIIITH